MIADIKSVSHISISFFFTTQNNQGFLSLDVKKVNAQMFQCNFQAEPQHCMSLKEHSTNFTHKDQFTCRFQSVETVV